MNRKSISLLALFLMLAGAGRGQQNSLQPAQSATVTPSSDYAFASVFSDQLTISNHKTIRGVAYIGSIAFADDGSVAFVAWWGDSTNRVGKITGVYVFGGGTSRTVVEEGETIGGNTVTEIQNHQKGDLQLNRGGVAYLAQFRGASCPAPAPSCTGLWVERQLVAMTTGTPGKWLLTDDGKIVAPAHHTWMTPPVGIANTADKSKKRHAWASVLCGLAPIYTIPGERTPGGGGLSPKPINACNAITPQSPPAGQNGQNAAILRPAELPLMAQPLNCPTPIGFKFPLVWGDGQSAAGPISWSRVEGTVSGQTYSSPFRAGTVPGWSRTVFYAADCRPVVMALAPSNGPAAVELRTPAGLIGFFDAAAGVYKFNGVTDVELPPSSEPIENGISVNRRCQVLIQVRFKRAFNSGDSGLILGSPLQPGHCPAE